MHTPRHPPSALILQHAPKRFIRPTLNNCAALLSTCMYMTPTCSLKAVRLCYNTVPFLSFPSNTTFGLYIGGSTRVGLMSEIRMSFGEPPIES